jgi:hypothetical protein
MDTQNEVDFLKKVYKYTGIIGWSVMLLLSSILIGLGFGYHQFASEDSLKVIALWAFLNTFTPAFLYVQYRVHLRLIVWRQKLIDKLFGKNNQASPT